jgi:outer membrane protein
MKKMIFMLAMVLPILASAQQKIAHVSSQEIMTLMPETKSMQNSLDSLMNARELEYAKMQEELNKKVVEFQQKQAELSPTMREYHQQDIVRMEQAIQMSAQTFQKEIQEKQMQLLQPIQAKLLKAIEDVAKAKGCTYVMDKSGLLYAGADALDLTADVKAQLGIK